MTDDILGSRTPMGYSIKLEPTSGEPTNIQTLQHDLTSRMGEWALRVHDVYYITGRGVSLSGQLLYGLPKKGDALDIASNQFVAILQGIEHYSLSGWAYPGAVVGLLLSKNVFDYRKSGGRIVVPATKDLFADARGWTVVGAKPDEVWSTKLRELSR